MHQLAGRILPMLLDFSSDMKRSAATNFGSIAHVRSLLSRVKIPAPGQFVKDHPQKYVFALCGENEGILILCVEVKCNGKG